MIEKNTNLGSVNISLDVVSTVAGGAATECYGVVGMASQKKLKDGFYELLKKENYSKGIIASDGETGLILDLYIILGYGIKINEIIKSAAEVLGGGGGGRLTLAQGAGPLSDKMEEAVDLAVDLVKN